MKARAFKPCGHPGCRALVDDGTNRCALHKPEAWKRRDDAPFRIRGRTLQRLRAELFAENPLCVRCEAKGIVRLATIRDHTIPLSIAGVDEPNNIGKAGLCQECSDAKTEQERLDALRG